MKKIYLLLIILMIMVTGCDSDKVRDVASFDKFSSVALSNKFEISNNMDSYDNVDYILNAMVAKLGEAEVEMVTYKDSDSAKTVQEKQIEQFNVRKSTGASINKDKGSNYYKYVMISNNMYMVSSRVDNTLVFCMTSLNNTDSVSKVIEDLGY